VEHSEIRMNNHLSLRLQVALLECRCTTNLG
jgi:hypothetical protein